MLLFCRVALSENRNKVNNLHMNINKGKKTCLKGALMYGKYKR